MRKNKIANIAYTCEAVAMATFPNSINSIFVNMNLANQMSYKTFYRNILDLEAKKILKLKKVSGKGKGVKYIIEKINYNVLTKEINKIKKL